MWDVPTEETGQTHGKVEWRLRAWQAPPLGTLHGRTPSLNDTVSSVLLSIERRRAFPAHSILPCLLQTRQTIEASFSNPAPWTRPFDAAMQPSFSRDGLDDCLADAVARFVGACSTSHAPSNNASSHRPIIIIQSTYILCPVF